MSNRNILRGNTADHIPGHFSPLVPAPPAETAVKKPVFFYVGKNQVRVDALVAACENGYAVENMTSAISLLSRIETCNGGGEPGIDFILLDAGAANPPEKLHNYLASSAYRSVPLLLELAEPGGTDLARYRQYRFLDDIIVPGQPVARLFSRAALIKRMKAIPANALNNKIEKGRSGSIGRNAAKRIGDLCFSATTIVLLSPVLLLIAALIKLESRGPLLHVTERVGRGFRVFRSYTFRVLVMAEERKLQPVLRLAHGLNTPLLYKPSEQQRCTHVGAFLRKTGLEWLPLLFNVLLGDMAVVGSRPLPLQTAAGLTTHEHANQLIAPIGLTGWWRAGSPDD